MLRRALDKIADQIIALDEASLSRLRKEYLNTVFKFEPNKEWEKAVIIYFIINGVIAKNDLFNRNIRALQQQPGGTGNGKPRGGGGGRLKVVK
jgi:hypothetical protein